MASDRDGHIRGGDAVPPPYAPALAVLAIAALFQLFGARRDAVDLDWLVALLVLAALAVVWVVPGWSARARTSRWLPAYAAIPLAVALFFQARVLAAPEQAGDQLLAVATTPPGPVVAGVLLVAALVVCLLGVFLPGNRAVSRERAVALAAAGALIGGLGVVAAAPVADRVIAAKPTPAIDHTVADGPRAKHEDIYVEPPEGDLDAGWSRSLPPGLADIPASVLVPGRDFVLTKRAHGGKYGLSALDADTGKERWHFLLDDSAVGQTVVEPELGVVAFAVDDVLVFLDVATGERTGQLALPRTVVGASGDEGDLSWSIVPTRPPGKEDTPSIQVVPSLVALAQYESVVSGDEGEQPRAVYLLNLRTRGLERLEKPPSPTCDYVSVVNQWSTATSFEAFLLRSGHGCGPTRVRYLLHERVFAAFDVPHPATHPCAAGCAVTKVAPIGSGLVVVEDADAQEPNTTVTSMYATSVGARLEWQRGYDAVAADVTVLLGGQLRERIRVQPFGRPAEVRSTAAPGRVLDSAEGPRASPDHVVVLSASEYDVRWYSREGSKVHVDREIAKDGEGSEPDDVAFRRLASVDAGCEITWFTVADARMLVQCGGDRPELRLLE
ncbi:MAG: hypothetical protein GEV07_22835 [Streptosporangiales bacterium]|nr:hypothetical protein [Streptosporangiales bacterium]